MTLTCEECGLTEPKQQESIPSVMLSFNEDGDGSNTTTNDAICPIHALCTACRDNKGFMEMHFYNGDPV